ncbi:transposase [Streptomyces sp. 891-h]|uniref:transposase n=1 Tax=unclassified Streptomyces TaxID=2593676 RepID=UPI001FAB26C9|nr:transposase [Streptomyces sp. 891-h]UNZ15820.1 transposase [Streptomyces sp. 891-h]
MRILGGAGAGCLAPAGSGFSAAMGLHAAVEQGQKPLFLLVTVGQRHDSPQFQPVLDGIRVPRTKPGRPRTRPVKVRADRTHGSRADRPYLRRRGVQCTTPEKADQIRQLPEARLPTRAPAEVRQ